MSESEKNQLEQYSKILLQKAKVIAQAEGYSFSDECYRLLESRVLLAVQRMIDEKRFETKDMVEVAENLSKIIHAMIKVARSFGELSLLHEYTIGQVFGYNNFVGIICPIWPFC